MSIHKAACDTLWTAVLRNVFLLFTTGAVKSHKLESVADPETLYRRVNMKSVRLSLVVSLFFTVGGGWGGGGELFNPGYANKSLKMISCYHEWSVSLSLIVRYTARGVTVARTASTHNHLVQRVVILLLDLRTTVQQVITCKYMNSWEGKLLIFEKVARNVWNKDVKLIKEH